MFTQSAFIRKNTIELKDKLSELGYDVSELKDTSECIATTSLFSKAVGINESSFDSTNPHHTWNCAGRIDCGKNEELFLAICALNDSTDKNQWFILEANIGSINFPESMLMRGEAVKCLVDKWNTDLDEDGASSYFSSRNWPSHKASLEELFKIFNKN